MKEGLGPKKLYSKSILNINIYIYRPVYMYISMQNDLLYNRSTYIIY